MTSHSTTTARCDPSPSGKVGPIDKDVEQSSSLNFAKFLNVVILALTALASWLFVSPHDDYAGSGLLCYVVNGFLITECTVVGSAFFFDTFGTTTFHKYKIRPEHVASQALIERSIWERIRKYRTEWITYTVTWTLSNMTFEDGDQSKYPGVAKSILQVAALCVFLDAYVYLVHYWMHTRQGHFCHKKHHSFRYVNCWFVDHETQLESFLIAVGKHGALAYFSPHPQTAFEYLFATKLWNVVAHCGYNLPIFQWVDRYLPFMGTPNRHEQHHYHGDANLSIFTTIFDYLGGSLVWTDDEATQWRREKFQSAKKLGSSDDIIQWKLDPASVVKPQ
uniref:Fatty acid hydroxylase domain-containing protein n=1 Tax=Entomoneis paludosa TaxID=265537 RepID=A0A7S2YG93_9STRA|mmetsp:Transcript_31967/g.66719  ORF Transcript_31967/g.66719 Transcript_31967/m.66719 type:complete len:334 (+) Transcript_31967:167-1168(+)|eukprot:CAMPEP_0172465458 /NCGR_PEP_ID=MMETSP1065-20121228/53577_1 /TAXON_ID=265537 /ORGANISM="Amphiprora paludosa, Strain CCMP125" /LENGTH=333 /DNA_ID=CAMNT_0013221987 /DNA_START=145 /DNA_END=1146 /DNA_ORIENTATION=-